MKSSCDITILFVDDEHDILSSMRRFLRKEPYHALFVDSGHDALEILSTRPVDIIITDLRMPEMDGLALLEKVKAAYPVVLRIILSATRDMDKMSEAVSTGTVYRFISKPLEPELFKRTILDVVDYHCPAELPEVTNL